MKYLSLKDSTIPENYRGDVNEMYRLLLQAGYAIRKEHLYIAWDRYSSSMAAGWMMHPDNGEDIYNCISSHIEYMGEA